MIQPYNPNSDAFLKGLQTIQNRAERAQQELTTGLRINSVSDAPDQISSLLQTRANIEQNSQTKINLGRVQTEVDTAESAMQTAVKGMEQAQVLASQGQTFSATAETRKTLGDQVESVLQEMVTISNTAVEGRYIFSGNSDQTAPYSIDLTQTSPVSPYAGTAATRQAQHPDGSTFAVAKTAQDIFDSSTAQNNVFTALNDLRVALQNNDQAGITSSLSLVNTATTYLNGQLAFYGAAQSRVQGAQDFAANLDTSLRTQLSGIQDADMTQAIVDLNQAKLQEDSALASEAKIPQKSLFDYLG